MFASRYMPCPDCGASLEQRETGGHVCEHQRRLDYQMFQLRDEVHPPGEQDPADLDPGWQAPDYPPQTWPDQ